MVNLETVREALSHLKGTIIGDYAEGKKVFCGDTEVDGMKLNIMSTNDTLKYISGFEVLKFSMFIRTSYCEVVDMQFAMVFKVNGFSTKKCNLSIPRKGFDYLVEWFTSCISNFILCENNIQVWNNAVKDSANSGSRECNCVYEVDYVRRNQCRLVSWSYDKICVGIGMDMVLKLSEHLKTHMLNFQHTNYYNGSIKDLLEQFNEFEMHRIIGARLNGSVKDLLCGTKLSMNDAIRKIMKSRTRRGVQNLITCTYINELGEYIVLCKWKVDYDNRELDISIQDGKILDLQKGTFYYCGEIFNKIEKRVQLPEGRAPIIFGDMTVEEFINRD